MQKVEHVAANTILYVSLKKAHILIFQTSYTESLYKQGTSQTKAGWGIYLMK